MQKFDDYSFDDFLEDISFIRFVKNGPQGNDDVWQQWVVSNPPNLDTYSQARRYILTAISITPVKDTEENRSAVWAKINSRIARQAKIAVMTKRIKIWSYSAAAALLLFACGYWYVTSQIIIQTGFGEQRSVTLPDNSIVKLNANSALRYPRAWRIHGVREVWLNGEAFFRVQHLNKQPQQVKPSERFVVHAGVVQVQVLGTEFNVKSRRNHVTVSLTKGKIGVSTGKNNPQFILAPGEAVRYQDKKIVRTAINRMNNQPLAWTKNQMIVNGITVAGIIENYEDTYGGHIILENPALGNKRIDGTISMTSKDATIYMLANLLNATVEPRNNGVYYIKLNHVK
ncbi:FecR domain-containing protein [Mucilaginibacter sp. RS28]|uniref:FecR domain-containing protein n=1 Tax=Mucilaginibacter straminoryzae TaxID=2932774 RepID=A0A9X1WZB0_9SPHI|nr:FecR domain-containing protein [Mucilaginibacter straminoryzae]MCJ8208402.1 FecR domain-containing protein [Mucilaginibacter straminoryzae]